MGRRDWRELRRRIQVILRQLTKLQDYRSGSATPERTAGTVIEQRGQIRILLEDSPSLTQRVPEVIGTEMPSARELAQSELSEFEETSLTSVENLTFTNDQVLGPWLPD